MACYATTYCNKIEIELSKLFVFTGLTNEIGFALKFQFSGHVSLFSLTSYEQIR